MAIQIIKSRYDKLIFGKHKGESIKFVLDVDASYILWLDTKEIVEFTEDIIDDAIRLERDQHREYLRDNYEEDWGQESWGDRD
jgi:hypothetical protein